jgi:hypothetical protein
MPFRRHHRRRRSPPTVAPSLSHVADKHSTVFALFDYSVHALARRLNETHHLRLQALPIVYTLFATPASSACP